MNSQKSIDTTPREEVFAGLHQFPESWKLKLYLITAEGIPFAPIDKVKDILAQLLESLTYRLSDEFNYSRTGFTIVHTGRRGICITIWHFGTWGTTFEIFSSVWYRYGYGFDGFEMLNDVEPAFCWYEFKRTKTELESILELAKTHTLNQISQRYISGDLI